ncbi:alpha/beta hydrolase [Cytobacillus sp. FSL W7-1323]|uniref:alpha/beta fold hydrolase n=1 Tax=unclassified Cytobacillus TaxID=2675268 RepID=UPI002B003089|nr:alpha/beta hydrolase [Cytobacillus sp. OWB-43]MEA1852090.1 alpha/beta hydrolase [Cytobacillus sp. OWB-43]
MPTIRVSKEMKIHYRVKGEGKPLIILHGLGNNSQSWTKQLDDLSKDFQVFVWDAPGYGQSSDPEEEFTSFRQFADILKQFVDALELQKFYLLGHSMGSAIAIDFTYRFKDRVELLIIADPTRGAAGNSEEENRKKLTRRVYNVTNLTGEELAKQRVRELLAPEANLEVVKEAERIMAQVRPKGYISVANSLYSLDHTDIYGSITTPTLILCGEFDKATPVEEAKIFHHAIAESQLVIIPNTGHLCYQEDPASFNEAVRTFLQNPVNI